MEILGIVLVFVFIFGTFVFISRYYEGKRREKLGMVASSLSMKYEPKDEGESLKSTLQNFRLMSLGNRQELYNVLRGQADQLQLAIFDYRYTIGGGKNSSTYNQTVMLVETSDMQLPKFKMRPENVFHRISGVQDIDFDDAPIFSKQYLLQGDDETAIRQLFSPAILAHFTKEEGLCVEGNQHQLILYKNGKRLSPEDIPSFMKKHLGVANLFVRP